MGHTSTACNGQCVAHGGRLPYQCFEPSNFVFEFATQDDGRRAAAFMSRVNSERLAAIAKDLGPHEFLFVAGISNEHVFRTCWGFGRLADAALTAAGERCPLGEDVGHRAHQIPRDAAEPGTASPQSSS